MSQKCRSMCVVRHTNLNSEDLVSSNQGLTNLGHYLSIHVLNLNKTRTYPTLLNPVISVTRLEVRATWHLIDLKHYHKTSKVQNVL